LSNKSGIEAYKEAIDDYYLKYVCGKDSNGRQLTKPKKTKDIYFFLIIFPILLKAWCFTFFASIPIASFG
jgi:hypothetical protein